MTIICSRVLVFVLFRLTSYKSNPNNLAISHRSLDILFKRLILDTVLPGAAWKHSGCFGERNAPNCYYLSNWRPLRILGKRGIILNQPALALYSLRWGCARTAKARVHHVITVCSLPKPVSMLMLARQRSIAERSRLTQIEATTAMKDDMKEYRKGTRPDAPAPVNFLGMGGTNQLKETGLEGGEFARQDRAVKNMEADGKHLHQQTVLCRTPFCRSRGLCSPARVDRCCHSSLSFQEVPDSDWVFDPCNICIASTDILPTTTGFASAKFWRTKLSKAQKRWLTRESCRFPWRIDKL